MFFCTIMNNCVRYARIKYNKGAAIATPFFIMPKIA